MALTPSYYQFADSQPDVELQPPHEYLFEQVGRARYKQQKFDQLASAAINGDTPDMVKLKEQQQALYDQLGQLATQTVDMPRDEFNRLKDELVNMAHQQVAMPQRQAPQAPSWQQGVAAGLGALMNPRYAASIAATPYQYQQGQADQQYQDAMRKYAEDQRLRGENIDFQTTMLGYQDKADRDVYAQNKDIRDNQIAVIQDRMKRLDADIARAQTAQDKLIAEQNKAKFSNAIRVYFDSNADITVRESAWKYLTEEEHLPYAPPEKTYKQKGAEATTDLTRERINDIIAMRPWKLKEAEGKYNLLLAQAGLTDSQKGLVDMRILYYPDEFRLKKAQLEIQAMNANTARMNAEGKGKAGASEGRLALNAQRQSLTALLTLNRSQIKAAKEEGDEEAVQALTQEQNDYKSQLYDINEQLQGNPKPDHSILDFNPFGGNPGNGGLTGPIGSGTGVVEPPKDIKVTFPPVGGGGGKGKQPKQPKQPRIRIVNIREHK